MRAVKSAWRPSGRGKSRIWDTEKRSARGRSSALKNNRDEGRYETSSLGRVRACEHQRVRSVLAAGGQQSSTDEGGKCDDCTDAGCASISLPSALVAVAARG